MLSNLSIAASQPIRVALRSYNLSLISTFGPAKSVHIADARVQRHLLSSNQNSGLKPRSAEASEVTSAPSDQEFALYAADLTRSLGQLARSHGFPVLTYLLDMARLEAETLAERGKAQRRPVN